MGLIMGRMSGVFVITFATLERTCGHTDKCQLNFNLNKFYAKIT